MSKGYTRLNEKCPYYNKKCRVPANCDENGLLSNENGTPLGLCDKFEESTQLSDEALAMITIPTATKNTPDCNRLSYCTSKESCDNGQILDEDGKKTGICRHYERQISGSPTQSSQEITHRTKSRDWWSRRDEDSQESLVRITEKGIPGRKPFS